MSFCLPPALYPGERLNWSAKAERSIQPGMPEIKHQSNYSRRDFESVIRDPFLIPLLRDLFVYYLKLFWEMSVCY
jgi:hypothetical protein